MFGEQDMYGVKQITIDDKSRVVLPSFTKIEPHDKLLILKSGEQLSISAKHQIDSLIEDLENIIWQSNNIDEIKKSREILEHLFANILIETECDNQKRIFLPRNFYETSDSNNLITVGCRNHIKVYKLEDWKKLSSK